MLACWVCSVLVMVASRCAWACRPVTWDGLRILSIPLSTRPS